MTERPTDSLDTLQVALADLATAIEWPDTPRLSLSVTAAIRSSGRESRAWRPARRGLLLGLAAALLLAGAAAAIGIALGGLRIISGGPPPGSPLPDALVLERGFGEPTTLEAAERALGGLLMPELPALGEPDHVFLDDRTQSAAFVWAARAALPADPGT